MEVGNRRLLLVTVAFATAVVVVLTLLVGIITKESFLQSSESVETEETALSEEGHAVRWRQQRFDYEAFRANMLESFCTNYGYTVMEDTRCTTKDNPCEGMDSFCFMKRCCCKEQVCDCSSATCTAAPHALKYCANDGKCRKTCDVKFILRRVDITSLCDNYTREEVEDYVDTTVDTILCARYCPYEGTPCKRGSCTGHPDATCKNRCNRECTPRYFLRGVDITGVCNRNTSYIESYVEMASCKLSCPFESTPCERKPCTGAPNATCENRCDGECAAKYFLRGVDITGVCNRDTSYIESYVETAFCVNSCPFGYIPCENEVCTGAPNATCKNRCDGECAVSYSLRGVDITGFCYLESHHIESYVDMVLKARGITTDNEDGDQGDNSGSGSGSIGNF